MHIQIFKNVLFLTIMSFIALDSQVIATREPREVYDPDRDTINNRYQHRPNTAGMRQFQDMAGMPQPQGMGGMGLQQAGLKGKGAKIQIIELNHNSSGQISAIGIVTDIARNETNLKIGEKVFLDQYILRNFGVQIAIGDKLKIGGASQTATSGYGNTRYKDVDSLVERVY
ncbi:MAG: hypothetical protein FJX71_03660 [Alphaproteobacteria bacterium]|nr:hypothetical protein [Alphaproteobacteria bacterium]